MAARRQWPFNGEHVRFAVVAVIVVAASALALTTALDPRSRPMNHNIAAGSVVNNRLAVGVDRAIMCACWTGPDGQMQKKVKFAITNESDSLWLDLAGGRDGSVYLYVAYPDEFEPVVKMPADVPGAVERAWIPVDGSPAGKPIRVTSATETVVPDRVDESVVEELGLEDGWTAWALPANPQGLTAALPDGYSTYPTWVEQRWLGPHDSYFGQGNGIGAWVFYIPLPDEISWLPGSRMMPTTMLESSYLDHFYRVVGVGIRDSEGRTVGFAPTPPESSFSSAGDF